MVQMPGKKSLENFTNIYVQRKGSKRASYLMKAKVPAMVASSLLFGVPLASNRSVTLKVVIYTKHVIYM